VKFRVVSSCILSHEFLLSVDMVGLLKSFIWFVGLCFYPLLLDLCFLTLSCTYFGFVLPRVVNWTCVWALFWLFSFSFLSVKAVAC
jgi:hypothetical protein